MDNNEYSYSYGYTQPKKEKKPIGIGSVIAICLIFSLVAGAVGGVIGYRLGGNDGAVLGNSVIYRDITLRDQNGNKVTNALTVGEVADAARDSVVEITTEAVSTGSFMMQYVAEGAGSGVIMTQDGYIATNHHVIDGATAISVRTTDGKSYKAKLIGSDAKTDLAVIKIEATGLKSAIVGDFDNCKLGDTVVAIGNPLGQLGGTVTDGIISALDREITIDENIMTLIQTNTAINPGNSGGGLFNTSGQLIGIVNAKSSGEDVEGLGFAIPIDLASAVITDLIEHGYVTGRVD
ncbi:MAG: trypsin-like peptidase domain-containing protein, partial [Clostridia bacterium]|nr:trypsin-like peptidase domain-containing protein [Clostridia bacterium]